MGLIHKLCHRAYRRTSSLGLSLDFDDLVQEACVTWMRCEKKFNPEAGFYFTTYLGTAVNNRLNQVIDRHCRTEVAVGGQSLDAPIDEDGGTLEEVLPDESVDLLGTVIAWDARRKMMESLSPLARWVVTTLESPSREVLAEWKAYQVVQDKRRANGEQVHPTSELNLTWLGRHFLLPKRLVSHQQWAELRRELKRITASM